MTFRLILTKVGYAAISMLALSVVVFFLVRLTGDPLQLILPESATPEDFARARVALGLDRPLYEQYAIFLGNVLRGDLGTSIAMRIPVSTLIAQRFPATLGLSAVALSIVLAVGIPLGIYAAYLRNSKVDRMVRVLAAVGQSAPSFWFGLMLILVFAVNFRILPSGGSASPAHFILPALTMALWPTAAVMRLMRSSMIEVLGSDYVRFLRAKGMPEHRLLWKHAARNAGLSTLTFIGVVTARLVTGSVVAETVFIWPGMGQLMVQSIDARDFPVTQAVLLVFSFIFIAVNLVVDLLYTVLDPRLR